MTSPRFLARSLERMRVFGDWHGNVQFALNQLERGLRDGITTFVHVGDFGLWPFGIPRSQWTKKYGFIREIQSLLELHDTVLGFIDGNHEDFGELAKLPRTSEGLGQVSDNIFYIPRGTAWQWRGTRFAGLGGAVSIDRQMRRPGHTWFPEEMITASDVALAKRAGTVDVLFTHDAPLLPFPKRSFGPAIDADADQNREYVAQAVSALRPKLLIHGHYHLAYVNRDEVPGTEVIGLDCDMGRARDNYVDLVPGRANPLVGRGDVLAGSSSASDFVDPGLLGRLEGYVAGLEPSSSSLVRSALSYATQLHANQVRTGFDGKTTPYIEHPVRVAVRLVEWGVVDPQVIAAALLHDTVEDCRDLIEGYLIASGTAEQWMRLQFGERVASVVGEVTNRSGQRYGDKIRGLATRGSTEALLVKASDLVDNAGSVPLGKPVSERAALLVAKYRPVFPMVSQALASKGYDVAARQLSEVATGLDKVFS